MRMELPFAENVVSELAYILPAKFAGCPPGMESLLLVKKLANWLLPQFGVTCSDVGGALGIDT